MILPHFQLQLREVLSKEVNKIVPLAMGDKMYILISMASPNKIELKKLKIYSQFSKNWIHLIIVACIGFFSIAIFTYWSGVEHSDKLGERFNGFVKSEMMSLVKSEVLNRIDEIDYDLEQIIAQENLNTQKKILQLRKLLLSQNRLTQMPQGEGRRRAAILSLESFVATDPDYLYFVMSPEGQLLRSGTDERMDRTNIMELYDSEGVPIARDILKAVDHPEGIHISYLWPKIKDGPPLKKTSFCFYLPEFDFIIGTGSYEEDVYDHLKETTFARMQSYYEDDENYVFIFGLDGIVRVHADSELVGKDLSLSGRDELINAHRAILQQLEKGNGFITYDFNKKNSGIISEKVTYAYLLDKWQVYIGMGFHTSDSLEEIRAYSKEFRDDQLKDIFITIFLLIFLSFIIFAYIKRGLDIQKKILKQDEIVFSQLLEYTNEGILIVSETQEILYSNQIVELIFKNDLREAFTTDLNNKFTPLDKGVFSFLNRENRKYFIRMNIENMLYKGKNSRIFLVENISDQYIRENELQRLAYFDPLTGLPNRRKLKDDFDDIVIETSQEKRAYCNVLSMLDIDLFKNVNDKYGHHMGDKVLIFFGEYIKKHIRKNEFIYRFGGEEFIILFHQLGLEKVKTILEGINSGLSEQMTLHFGFPVTFSAGAVNIGISEKGKDLESLSKKADNLLYQAKRNGRNRIEIEPDDSMGQS